MRGLGPPRQRRIILGHVKQTTSSRIHFSLELQLLGRIRTAFMGSIKTGVYCEVRSSVLCCTSAPESRKHVQVETLRSVTFINVSYENCGI